MKITLTQEYEIEIPKKCEKLSKEELLNEINAMYDVRSKGIIEAMSGEGDYICTTLTLIDGEDVCIEGNDIGYNGSPIILDGQPLDKD